MRHCLTAGRAVAGALAVVLIAAAAMPATANEPSRPAEPATTPPQTPPAAPASTPPAQPAETSASAAKTETANEPPRPAPPPPPTLFARINLTTQTMVVQAHGRVIHTWKVSSGAPGYATPPGTFRPGWMAKDWRSRQYDDAPMPYSVFFNGGIAVHGTMHPGSLGRAASHGCVRLAIPNAARFFSLVRAHGMAQTRIVVHGAQPFSRHQNIAARARNRNTRSGSEWVYRPSTPAAAQRRGRGDSYRYAPAPQQRRAAAIRTQPAWARY